VVSFAHLDVAIAQGLAVVPTGMPNTQLVRKQLLNSYGQHLA